MQREQEALMAEFSARRRRDQTKRDALLRTPPTFDALGETANELERRAWANLSDISLESPTQNDLVRTLSNVASGRSSSRSPSQKKASIPCDH